MNFEATMMDFGEPGGDTYGAPADDFSAFFAGDESASIGEFSVTPPSNAGGSALPWGSPGALLPPDESSPGATSVFDASPDDVSSGCTPLSGPFAASLPTQHRAPIKQESPVAPSLLPPGPGVSTGDVLPSGVALPAVLGGKMPAPSRKRRRKHSPESEEDDSDDAGRLAVRLPRDTLLSLSSSQMSKYVRFMRDTKSLTPAQQKELKQQKRLVKNRESARLSRQRKQDHISTLEGQIAEMRLEMEALRGQNQALLQENQRIMQVVQHKSPSMQQQQQQAQQQMMPQQRQQQPTQQQQQQVEEPHVRNPSERHADILPTRTLRAAGICIFVIMFSFGLFFRASPDIDSGVVIKREVLPRAPPGRVMANEQPPATAGPARSSPRYLFGHEEQPPDVSVLHPAEEPVDPDDAFVPAWSNPMKPVENWRPRDMTYLVSRDLTRVNPTPCTEADCHQRSRVGLLVPLSSLAPNASLSPEEKTNFVELICRVDEVNIVPRAALENAAAATSAAAAASPTTEAAPGA